MQLADLTIDQPQQQTEQLVRTYVNILDAEGTSVAAVSQFESDCLVLVEEGWRLKQVSHRETMVVAMYEKEA